MNKWMERYIYDVTRRLPEKERDEVKRELEAVITDMLSDNPTEEDIVSVLTKLGPPRILAEQYRQNPRYLISPAMFELYISVLKTVILIAAGVFACIGILSAIAPYLGDWNMNFEVVQPGIVQSYAQDMDMNRLMTLTAGGVVEIIVTIVSMALQGALYAAFWVTLIFTLTERFGLKQKPWTVSTLPNLPSLPNQKDVKISRPSSIAGIILSVFFTVLFIMMILRSEWFFVLIRGNTVIFPFSREACIRCIPYLALSGAMGVAINGLKLYWARWNLPLCIANMVHDVVCIGCVIYILHWPDLFNPQFIAFVADSLTDGINIFPDFLPGGLVTFLTVVLVLVVIIDIGVSIWYTWKGKRYAEGNRGE